MILVKAFGQNQFLDSKGIEISERVHFKLNKTHKIILICLICVSNFNIFLNI